MTFISILICLLLKTAISFTCTDGQLVELWNAKVLIANFGLLFAGYPFFEMLGINNPVWYICVLVQCYVIYYVFEWVLKKCNAEKKNLWRIVFYSLLVVSSFMAFHFELLNESSFRGRNSFSTGILVYIVNDFIQRKRFISVKNQKYLCIVFLGLAVLSCGLVFFRINQRWVLQFLVYPTLVIGVVNTPFTGIKAVSSLGDISFDLYVFHYPLMVLVQLILSLTGWTLAHSYITMAIFLIFAWAIAFLLWKYIDLPIRKKIRSFEKKYE